MSTRKLPTDSVIIYDSPLEDEAPEQPIIISSYDGRNGIGFINRDYEVFATYQMIPDIIKTLNKIYKENKNGTSGTL